MPKLIKITISILLFGCLLQLPYGYYILVRYLALVGFTILAYLEFIKSHEKTAFVYVVLALLFQPIFKIPLGRELWVVVDVLVGAGLIISLFMKSDALKDS